MKHAIVSLGYTCQFAVPVADLSKLLTLLQACPRVDSTYRSNSGEVYYLKPDADAVRVVLTDAILPARPADES